jgi:hypothetical protein
VEITGSELGILERRGQLVLHPASYRLVLKAESRE